MSDSSLKTVKVPKPVSLATTRFRPPKTNIPQTKKERDALLSLVRSYVERLKLVPPMPLEELESHARLLLSEAGLDEVFFHYAAVCLNNEAWRETLATIPFEKRLLLMPKCLRVEEKCPALIDEFGLLCKGCGLCTIEDFQTEAEKLGYAVMVAEGSALVMSLIQTGQVEALVGISCLSVLERTFPYVEAAAIPAIAVPLLQDDCVNTTVDIDWVWDYLHLTGEDRTRRLNLSDLLAEVRGWFGREEMDGWMGLAQGHAESVAREWLAKDGKRWRPFLAVAAYLALMDDPSASLPEQIKKLALAVECFHKASLIHDDIEDGDFERYGEATLQASEGMEVALNAGDLLIGEGYRLIGELDLPAERIVQMLRVAAAGQRELCRGQGAELAWARDPRPLKTAQVLEIFRQKTAPAFEVALKLGAAFAGRLDEVDEVLGRYSEALGIAYQIRDDLDDLSEDTGDNLMESIRPGVLLAKGRELARGGDRAWLEDLWSRKLAAGVTAAEVREVLHRVGADEKCLRLLETYKKAAVHSLADLDQANLKGLLRRVLGKIFNDLEIKGWCREFEVRNGVRLAEAGASFAVPAETIVTGAAAGAMG